MHTLRSLLVIMLTAVAVLVVATPSDAAVSRGSIQIHSRVCDPGAIQLYRDCHDNPGPAGATYTIDKRVPKAIADSGNVSFGRVIAGDHLVTLTSGYDPDAHSRLYAYCSNSTTGLYPTIATILYSETPQFWVRLAAGSRLTCDVYFVP